MPLCLEFVERLLIPLVGDHVRVVGHQRLEAVKPRWIDGVGSAETNTK